MPTELYSVVIDAHDPAALARFWAAVLGYSDAYTLADEVAIEAPSESGPAIVSVALAEGKSSKNRLHFDLNPDDQAAEIDAGARGPAPEFGGTLLDGGQFDSTELAGDVAVVNFWGSWCGPCRVESPEFQDVYDDVRDEGVSFLGINVKDGDQQARAFVAAKGITFPSIFDPRGEVTLAFRDFPPSAIPSTILLDRDGRVAAVYLGAVSQDTLRAVLDVLLAET